MDPTGIAAMSGALQGVIAQRNLRYQQAMQARQAQIEHEKAIYGYLGLYGRGMLAAQQRAASEQNVASMNNAGRQVVAQTNAQARMATSPYAQGGAPSGPRVTPYTQALIANRAAQAGAYNATAGTVDPSIAARNNAQATVVDPSVAARNNAAAQQVSALTPPKQQLMIDQGNGYNALAGLNYMRTRDMPSVDAARIRYEAALGSAAGTRAAAAQTAAGAGMLRAKTYAGVVGPAMARHWSASDDAAMQRLGIDRAKLGTAIQRDPSLQQAVKMFTDAQSLWSRATAAPTDPTAPGYIAPAQRDQLLHQANQVMRTYGSRIQSATGSPPTEPATSPQPGAHPAAQGHTAPPAFYGDHALKTIGRVTKTVAEWRREYEAAKGKPAPF